MLKHAENPPCIASLDNRFTAELSIEKHLTPTVVQNDLSSAKPIRNREQLHTAQ
jgi:hypothetical protein